jgi:hypothetical protein
METAYSAADMKSTQEEDLLQRSTNGDHGSSSLSYIDKLLNVADEDAIKDIILIVDITMGEDTGTVVADNGIMIELTNEELQNWSKQYTNTLVVVLGKRVNFRVLENKLKRSWTNNGAIQIIDMHDGYYQVIFSNEEDYKHALFEGPWMVADHVFIVQRWRPLFLLNAEASHKVAIWVRISRLPIELYNDTFLKRIGNSMGTFLKMDRLTSIHSRGKFARICVEMDLDRALPTHIVIRGHRIYLEYEGLHSICFKCGKFGHKKENCREHDSESVNKDKGHQKDAKTNLEEKLKSQGEKANS